MKYMSHDEIRNTWFKFFEDKGHKIYESSSLIPVDDNSLLFVNAGVTPLKKYFDGSVVPDSKRIVSIQKCIRTNDIDNVGITKRHQTFFEMMGNFSIGDYFKEEAISYSMELLTSPKYFAIDKNLLYVTIYTDDDVAYNRWIEVGIDPSHIIRLEGNFWEIGEGPCGPDSEIFFDRGEKYDPNLDALEKFKNDLDQERYVEIWNNVFSQFNSKDGLLRSEYEELPNKNIDTGAGLERWCCIFQGVDSNFETDLFKPIIDLIVYLAGASYTGQKEYKIIADHIRSLVFALADGAYFENTGRGYVLRRLLRRSVRFGKKLNIECPFMYKLVSDVVDVMKDAYPYLTSKRAIIETIVLEEEKLFLKTLDAGERRLKELVKNSNDGYISSEEAFKLYDTYGFPFELTLEYLNELGYTVSKEEFDKYMNIQKELARKSNKNKATMASQKKVLLDFKDESQFVYSIYRLKTNVLAIFSLDNIVDSINHDCYLALDRTCFYAESGGQVSDTGMLIGKNFKARVLEVFKGPNGQHIHKVKLLDGTINSGDNCEAVVDKDRRKKIEANHSSVHILQYSLQQTISASIKQAGSYVDDDKFRFDFTYSGKINDDAILEVESFARNMISKNLIVSTEIMPLDKAKDLGAMALFGEKYSDIVRVVKIGKSIELCGGTHVSNTKDILNFTIYSLETKGSNVYRIEGATGSRAEDFLLAAIKPYNDEKIKLLVKARNILDMANNEGIKLNFDVNIENSRPNSYRNIIFDKNELIYVQQEVKKLEKEYFTLREKKSLSNLDIYKEHIKDHNGTLGIVMEINNKDILLLKSIADSLIGIMGKGFVFFANVKSDGSVNYLARSNCSLNAGLIVKKASVSSSGNGGGSPTFAQGGGKEVSNLKYILEEVEKELNETE